MTLTPQPAHEKTGIDSGPAWARRWFAKPFVSGSIPATVSNIAPKYGQRWFGVGHRFQLGQAFVRAIARMGGSSFTAGMRQEAMHGKPTRYPADYSNDDLQSLVSHHHGKHIDAATKLSETRDALIAARRELSAIKRGKP